jgi:hypothetical protein
VSDQEYDLFVRGLDDDEDREIDWPYRVRNGAPDAYAWSVDNLRNIEVPVEEATEKKKLILPKEG